MSLAIEQAKFALDSGDLPIGAVIVHNDEIIATGYNQVELLKDSTAHCELIAIRQASLYLGHKFLEECTLYVTLEPCAMCAGAIVLSRIPELVFGANEPKTGACGSLYLIADDSRLNHRAKIIGGIMEQECAEMLRDFFKLKRETNV